MFCKMNVFLYCIIPDVFTAIIVIS
uniref:Uncharacterized protein n=1 Tax=Rhizophora mucronata TaxID=61149 RepID=A0A2P2QS69_RHIMU